VTDDADAFKEVANRSGLDHQVCKSHVVRNTEELIARLSLVVQSRPEDPCLADLYIVASRALADLHRLGELIHSRQPEQQAEVQA